MDQRPRQKRRGFLFWGWSWPCRACRGLGNGVCARPLAAPSGFARTLLRLCFAKLLASLVGGPDGFAAGASRAQATRRLPARANDARPRNAAGLSCGVPPPERARQRVGQKVAWMLHPVTSVTTRERPSPRAAASFRPSAHDKPQRHENCLRSTRKRPLRGLHESTKSPRGAYVAVHESSQNQSHQ